MVPSGHVVVAGGGGGGGGQGSPSGTIEPSGQVWVAGARGAVAQAEIASIDAKSTAIRIILLSFEDHLR